MSFIDNKHGFVNDLLTKRSFSDFLIFPLLVFCKLPYACTKLSVCRTAGILMIDQYKRNRETLN